MNVTAKLDLTAFRAGFRSWLRSVEIPELAEDLDERFVELRAWQAVMHRAGFVGLTWPTEWGGHGLTFQHQQVVNEELVLARAPMPIGLIGLDVVGPSIGHYGTPQQRQNLLPDLLSGRNIWCQGFSEPGAGSDLAAIRTRARIEGDEYVIDGQKVWTSWAQYADWCALLVRTNPESARHRGLSYVLVDMHSPGITVRPLEQMTGESEFGEVFFDEVRVPLTNLVGEAEKGWTIAMDTLSHERGTFGMRRQVEISGPFGEAIDTLRATVQSGRAVPERLVEMLGCSRVAEKVLQSAVAATIERASAGTGPSALDSVDKLILAECEQEMFGGLREIVGPLLTNRDSSAWGLRSSTVARDYLYGRAASIYGGSAQIQRNIVAERMMGLPRD